MYSLQASSGLNAMESNGLNLTENDLRSSLNQAREHRATTSEGARIQLESGTYRLANSIILSSQDSGSPLAPTVIRGSDRGTTISGGTLGPIKYLEEKWIPERLRNAGAVLIDFSAGWKAPLPTVTRRGAYVTVSSSEFELYQGQERLRQARWPKHGLLEGETESIPGTRDSWRISLPEKLIASTEDEPNLWVGGYWTADWAYETTPVDRIIASENSLEFSGLRSPGPVRKHVRFFVGNARFALSSAGEYVVGKDHSVLVIPHPNAPPLERVIAKTLIDVENVHDLVIENIALEKALGTILKISHSRNITIRDCFIGHGGAQGISISDSYNVTIEDCVVRDVSETGIAISGGDRQELISANVQIRNSAISDFGSGSRTYRPAVQIEGVGSTVVGCLLNNGPHSAIVMKGNDHLIKDNEISNVVTESDDAGAIYAGRDWTDRGNVIEGNFIHDVGEQRTASGGVIREPSFVSGIYLDDQESGFHVRDNVFLRVSRPIVIHGGRDNRVERNAFLLATHGAIWLGKRGEGLSNGQLERRLRTMPFEGPLWSGRYPELAKIAANDPASPLNNYEAGNLVVGPQLLEFGNETDRVYWPADSGSDRIRAAQLEDTQSMVAADRLAENLLLSAGAPFSRYALANRTAKLAGLRFRSH